MLALATKTARSARQVIETETPALAANPLEELERVQNVLFARRRVKRGEALFNAGCEFGSLYSIRSGFFKTIVIDREGREQVTGFHMAGELLGLDGIGAGAYDVTAIALEDSEVCAMPFAMLEGFAREMPAFQRHLHGMLAREIVANHGIMMLLGSMTAEQRVAAFLMNLSRRSERRGYSATEFHLRMSREEIGSYLGLKLETVSRVFSRLQHEGVLEVQGKHLRVAQPERLAAALKS